MDALQARVIGVMEAFQGRPWAQALIILIGSIATAYILTAIIKKGLLRLVHKTRFQLDSEIISILHQPVFYSILMVGLAVALSASPIGGSLESAAVSLLKTANIFIWTVFFIRLSSILLKASVRHPHRQQMVNQQSLPLFENFAFLIIFGLALYLAFQTWGIDMTAWLASAGVLAIAVGFAAKDTLSNFIAGIFILAEAPYKIGDYIVLDSGERGAITAIGIRSTRLLTRDDVELTIPNGIMGNSKIVNETGGPYQKFRIRIPVGVGYDSDVEQVKSVLYEVAIASEDVCGYPEPRVRFRRFGASSLDFELLCWVEQPSQRGLVVDLLLTAIHQRFIQEGLEIPYAQYDLHIKETPPPAAPASTPSTPP